MKKGYFNIPNLMGYFRIILIPVFLLLYYRADTSAGYGLAFFVLALSYVSDFLDGKIARKFNMVTDWGKMLDPIADKLTQGALAVACTFRYPAAVWLIFFFLAREVYMGIMGLYLVKGKHVVYGAQFFGKICTAVLDVGILVLLLFPGMPLLLSNLCILLLMVSIVITWLKYIGFHIRLLTGKQKRRIKMRWKIVIVALFVIYLVVGAVIPYVHQQEMGESNKNSFNPAQFYGSQECCDRAAIIEDNGEALEERIRMIEHARDSIVLSTFDFHSDQTGKQILAALKTAAGRGVQVKILMDGYNSWLRMTGNPYFYALAADENVTVKIYNPVNPLVPWKAMSRMHDKYLIVDDSLYLLGGRNVYDYFLGNQDGYKNYDRDVLVYNTGGEDSSLYRVRDYFENIWNSSLCRTWNDAGWLLRIPGVGKAQSELEEIYHVMKRDYPMWFVKGDYRERTFETDKITLLCNPTGLYSKEPQVFYGLSELMKQADQEVIWHTPYIINNDWMYGKVQEIAKEVPSVTIMTNSSKNNGNPFGAVDYAMHKKDILATGVTVKEYEGGVSYHGKSAVIDDEIAIVGSFNMDMKSTYQDTELMLVINSKEVSGQLKENLLSYQEDSKIANLEKNDEDDLFGEGVSTIEKFQHFVIRKVNPYLRFLF